MALIQITRNYRAITNLKTLQPTVTSTTVLSVLQSPLAYILRVKNQAWVSAVCILLSFTLRRRKWRQQVPPKHRNSGNRLQDITTQEDNTIHSHLSANFKPHSNQIIALLFWATSVKIADWKNGAKW
jgi:hypothetical protein